ncbi:MAG: ABC transporter ATP-binding protein [Xanthobacteraceae bacterium]|nr:ABC transporter ATP-binding protein [Xanthobacteraceae bacterium]
MTSASPGPVDVAEPLLSLSAITKRFGSFTAISDVSLDLRPGEIHCILGENGAGKSTLCNLIFGVHQPDSGAMRYRGAPFHPSNPADSLSQGIAMVHQHFSLVPDLTVVDNVLLGRQSGILDRKACAAELEKLADDYGLPLDPFAKIQNISVGERQRVEIVKCLIRDPSLFVLDEPTAVLLPDEISALLNVCRRVASSGRAVVLVTHKLAEIKKIADRVSVLRAGRIVTTSDRPAEDIDMLVRAMIQGNVEQLDTSAASVLGIKPVIHVGHDQTVAKTKVEALQIDGLTVKDHQGVTRLDNFTLTVDRGEIVGVAGVEGNGQSELTAVLAGMVLPTEGRIHLGSVELTARSPREITAAGVGIVPEDRHTVGSVTGMSVSENIYLNRLDEFTRFGFLNRSALQQEASVLMQRFDVRARGPSSLFSSLSGGNQQKAVLARELTLRNLSCLVAAQPTRGLDVGAVAAVYSHIRGASDRGVAVLLVSSELDELLTVADRIVVLYRGRIMGSCRADPAQRELIGAMMAGQHQ